MDGIINTEHKKKYHFIFQCYFLLPNEHLNLKINALLPPRLLKTTLQKRNTNSSWNLNHLYNDYLSYLNSVLFRTVCFLILPGLLKRARHNYLLTTTSKTMLTKKI